MRSAIFTYRAISPPDTEAMIGVTLPRCGTYPKSVWGVGSGVDVGPQTTQYTNPRMMLIPDGRRINAQMHSVPEIIF